MSEDEAGKSSPISLSSEPRLAKEVHEGAEGRHHGPQLL